jgi:ankyrin repeat protein
MHVAAAAGNTHMLAQLIREVQEGRMTPSPLCTPHHRETLLTLACRSSAVDEMLPLLLATGQPWIGGVNDRNREGATCLTRLMKLRDLALVKRLVEGHGASVNVPGLVQPWMGEPAGSHAGAAYDARLLPAEPLLAACKRGHLDIVAYLLERGASLDAVDPLSCRNALAYAAVEGHVPVLREQLRRGMDIEGSSSIGQPVVDAARS